MNGFSDVRLAFHSQELNESQPVVFKAVQNNRVCVPTGMSSFAISASTFGRPESRQ